MVTAALAAGDPHGLARLTGLAAGAAALPGGRALPVAALVSWLLAESLGAYMLRNWVASGGIRRRHAAVDGMSVPVLLGHAGLAASGLTCWVIFLITGAAVPAWLAVGFLAPAIGLGVSTVTVWTPYPVRRAEHRARAAPSAARPISDEMLARALADEEMTAMLVDDLLASALSVAPARPRTRARSLEPLVPAVHGVLALVTFLLAMLAAVEAIT